MNHAEVPVAVSRHGLTVPRLGFGTARIPADQAERAVRLAIDAGYRLLDTATAYGTEAGIGRAIRKSRVARDQLVVTTKLHRADQGFTPALKAFDRSRRRLGLDAIDLYLIHWPLPMRDLYVETWRALEIIRGRGLAREIGVSNFTDAQLARLIAETGIVPAVNQVELHPGFTQAELRRYHDAHAILTQAWSPLGAGRGLPGTEVVARVAERCRRSPAQVVLRWHLQLGTIAIPKSVNPDHIRQNIDIFGFALSAADMDELTGIGSGTRLGPDPDSFDPPWESETRRPPGAAARLVGEGTLALTETVLEGVRRKYRASGQHSGLELGAGLGAAVGRHASDPVTFLSEPAEQVTVGELFADAQRLAAVLRHDGLVPGEAAGIQLPNSRRAWLIYLACLIAGAVVVPIVPTFGPSEVAFCLTDSKARRFFVADRWRRTDYLAGLGPVRASGSLENITVVGDDVPPDCVPFARLEAQMASESGTAVSGMARGDGHADCFICYTSGSTARPKGARHTHDDVLAELVQTQARWPDRQVAFTARPLGTIAGLLAVLRTMYMPAETYVMDRWDTPSALEVIREQGVTLLPTVPFMLTTMLDQLDREGSRLPSLKDVSCGGSSVPPLLIERADDLGIRCYRLFGSTEHPTVTSGHPGEELRFRAATDGRLLPGAALKVIDGEGREVAPGDQGEIVTAGPDRFAGYLDPVANDAAFTADGWLRSGDLGYLTPTGHLVVTGRAKDLIIRAGINLAPAAIEDVMARHPAVAEVAVTGVADREYGERAAAFVVLRPGAELSLPEVRRHFERCGVARQKTPEYLVVKESMPRTGSGKIAKRQLREELESGLR